MSTATNRLRSRNSPMAEGAAGLARPARRALRPPTRSFSWLRTDIRMWPVADSRRLTDTDPFRGSDYDFAENVRSPLFLGGVVCYRISISIIGFYDFCHQGMANDIRPAEGMKIDAGDVGKDV